MNRAIHHLPQLSISAAQRLFGLTARALRFYEQQGLIEVRRDRRNYRYYDATARERLEWILRLRRADVPLADIREVLDAESGADREARATTKLAEARAKALSKATAADAAIAEILGAHLSAACRGRRVV